MAGELVAPFTPEKLQDYLTCPNLYYFKHVAKVPVLTKAYHWMDESIHQAILETLSAKESTACCLQRFEEIFKSPQTLYLLEMELDWTGDSPEKLLIKGRGILQLYTAMPLFQDLRPILVGQLVMMNLGVLGSKTMFPSFYPSLCGPSEDISVGCPIDAILADGTIVDIRLSSRQVAEEDLCRKLIFDFYLLATLYLPQIRLNPEQSIRCDILIRTKDPKIQVLRMTKQWQDYTRLLTLLYPVFQAIQEELYYPTPNILCSQHCAYKAMCHPTLAYPSLSSTTKANWRENLRAGLDFHHALSSY